MGSLLFRFFISGEEKEVLSGSELWELPLSGRKSSPIDTFAKTITTGDYFRAAAAFLSRQDYSALTKGLESFFQSPVPSLI